MYFKIKDTIFFRKYDNYGLLCDNSMFEYKFLSDQKHSLNDRYVSEVASIMLEKLEKKPKKIDDIIDLLIDIFEDVEYDMLKKDTIEFFDGLVEEGYLVKGETYEKCLSSEKNCDSQLFLKNEGSEKLTMKNCNSNAFKIGDFLKSIHIEVTSECNERCVHCYIPHEYKVNKMCTEMFYKILKEARDMNAINITISGGEPLLHENIIDFLRFCRKNDFSVNLLTNLTLLNDEIFNEIKKNKMISIQTSIYSMIPAIHDSITKVSGSFEKTLHNLLVLLNSKIPVQISCPVMKQNKDTFYTVVEWGYEHDIAVYTDLEIFASYGDENENIKNRLNVHEFSTAFTLQLSKSFANDMRTIAKEKEMVEPNDSICSICRYYLCVSAEGNIFPCVGWQSNVVGNIDKTSLKYVWENSSVIKRLRNIQRKEFTKCVACEDRGYCTVCMMCNFNESSTNDIYEINPIHCQLAKIVHQKVDNCLSDVGGLYEDK